MLSVVVANWAAFCSPDAVKMLTVTWAVRQAELEACASACVCVLQSPPVPRGGGVASPNLPMHGHRLCVRPPSSGALRVDRRIGLTVLSPLQCSPLKLDVAGVAGHSTSVAWGLVFSK